MNNIKIFRTSIGDIIGKLNDTKNDVFNIQDAVGVKYESHNNEIMVGYMCLAPFSEDTSMDVPQMNINVPVSTVFFYYTPNNDMVQGYLDMLKGKEEDNSPKIITPSEPKIII
jgi:hypothetical protein